MTQRVISSDAETRGGTTSAGDKTERYTEITFRMMNSHRTKRRRVTMNLESGRFTLITRKSGRRQKRQRTEFMTVAGVE